MSNESRLRKTLRGAEARRGGDATVTLGQLRANSPVAEYATLFSAFRLAAPKTFHALCRRGPSSPSELVFRRQALPPLTLERELLWAACWLPSLVKQINTFRRCADEINCLVVKGGYGAAQSLLDGYVNVEGWSLWAIELRAALIQMAHGTVAQREWLAQLQAKAVNSIPGLLFEVIGDRNDEAYSYDAIYAKCMSSFPRFGSLAPWLVDYLNFRALAHVSNPSSALPHVLCRDITSSLVDYYEDVVETLLYVEGDVPSSRLRATVCQLVSSLIHAGFHDHRLKKLALGLTVTALDGIDIYDRPEEDYRAVYLGAFEPAAATMPISIAPDLLEVQNKGAAAYDLVGKLLKWGGNLRGLGIGPAVALAALRATSDGRDERVLPPNTLLVSELFCVDDAVAFSWKGAQQVINEYLKNRGVTIVGEELFKPSCWGIRDALPHGGPVYLWLGRQLLERKDYSEFLYLKRMLQGTTPYWDRQFAKLNILADLQQCNVESALVELERWYRRSSFYAIEFLADVLFDGKKWSDFRHIDPILVGLVAHREYVTRNSANVSYICKMACRSFLQSGFRGRVADEFPDESEERKEQVIAFFRDVWIEENLSLCHQFETTADIRVERMSILQLLLSWDDQHAPEYTEAIKDLTFDQTLLRGLQRIDQTRVFVNEPAITRWAEKELEQDYDRWRALTESDSGGRAVDDMLRQYAVDPTNLELLKELTDGKPTAASALLIDLVDRLYKRFLFDPTDGLDTYLSVRVRHGSLRGTILGPLEEQNLLYSGSGFSQEAFELRWGNELNLSLVEKEQLVAVMQEYSTDMIRAVDGFIDQFVQVRRAEKPNGVFWQVLPPTFAKLIGVSLAERPISFHAFLCVGYFCFWSLVKQGLVELRKRVSEDLAGLLHDRIERLIGDLRTLGPECLPLITALTTVSTMTRSQCDTVAEWFQLPSDAGSETYLLPDAIEIASVATKNVYRAFAANVRIQSLPEILLPLTTSGLAVLTDCLFVIFENAWKHSGLFGDLFEIDIYTEYEPSSKLLTLRCWSALSEARRQELLDGELTQLRSKYLGDLPLELINSEGGSGFPKLARLTRGVRPNVCPQAFDFGVENGQWFTRLTLPLYGREGAFEAYE